MGKHYWVVRCASCGLYGPITWTEQTKKPLSDVDRAELSRHHTDQQGCAGPDLHPWEITKAVYYALLWKMKEDQIRDGGEVHSLPQRPDPQDVN